MKNIKGLGDLVALILAPLAFVLRRLGYKVGVDPTPVEEVPTVNPTPISNNGGCGCKKRQEKLNNLVPNPFSK